jgi:hypothetical protein
MSGTNTKDDNICVRIVVRGILSLKKIMVLHVDDDVEHRVCIDLSISNTALHQSIITHIQLLPEKALDFRDENPKPFNFKIAKTDKVVTARYKFAGSQLLITEIGNPNV